MVLGLERRVVDEPGVEVVLDVLVHQLRFGDGAVPAAVTGGCALPFPFSSAVCWSDAISSVSMPVSASTWWRLSSVPDAVRTGSCDEDRSSPSMSP